MITKYQALQFMVGRLRWIMVARNENELERLELAAIEDTDFILDFGVMTAVEVDGLRRQIAAAIKQRRVELDLESTIPTKVLHLRPRLRVVS